MLCSSGQWANSDCLLRVTRLYRATISGGNHFQDTLLVPRCKYWLVAERRHDTYCDPRAGGKQALFSLSTPHATQSLICTENLAERICQQTGIVDISVVLNH